MYRFDPEHYLNSPKLLLAQHRRRARRRLHFTIDGIEPRAKHSMPDPDKDEVQGQLLKHLVDRRRRAFQGPLALRIRLATTERSPTHSQNIAKNLLDLFGRPRQSLATRRTSLLYADDNQVHALAVTCDHGRTVPIISVSANPLATLLADLDLAMQHGRGDGDAECERSYELDDPMDHVGTLLHDEAAFRSRIGDRAFDTWLRFSRQRAQECLLGRAGVTPIYLANMYSRNKVTPPPIWTGGGGLARSKRGLGKQLYAMEHTGPRKLVPLEPEIRDAQAGGVVAHDALDILRETFGSLGVDVER